MINNLLNFVYIFLDILPFSILRYYLFIDCLAISVKKLIAILVSLTTIEALGFIYIFNQPWQLQIHLTIYRYIFIIIFALLSFVFIKEQLSKILFIYLIVFCYDGFIIGNAIFIEARFFSLISIKHPYLVSNLVKIILIAITFPFIFYVLKNYFKKLMDTVNSDIWKYIWIIPLMFSSIGVIYSFPSLREKTSEIHFILLRYLIFIGAFYTCFILLKSLRQTELNIRLEENIKLNENQLNMQKEHYIMLNKTIEETKKAKHDLRHHIYLIQSFLKDKQYDKLQEYINQYQSSLPIDNDIVICENYVVNAILSHYINLAKSENIYLSIDIKIPTSTFISDIDFCIILGNCLENAIEACKRITEGARFIFIKSQNTNYMIGLTIDNSFSGQIIKENSNFLSTKKSVGSGIGISSIQSVAAKYGGTTKFEIDTENKIFKVSILLKNTLCQGMP